MTGANKRGDPVAEPAIGVDPAELSRILGAPGWLRKVGLMSWLLLGVALLIAALVWVASLVQVIVIPVIVAAIIASICSPAVGWLEARRVPRFAGTALVMLLIVLAGTGLALLLIQGIVAEIDPISSALKHGLDGLANDLKGLGLSPKNADLARDGASSGASSAVSTLLHGLFSGIRGLSSAVFFLAMTALSLFFLLKDGPTIRSWVEGHSGLPGPVSRIVSGRAMRSLRAYFLGVSIVAAFSSVIVLIGTLIIGVPLAGTIAVVTFAAGFVPYLGAWTAGIFSVVIAYGAGGVDAAAAMMVVQLLANGALQQLIQPFAMGSVLGIHPLAVLIVSIAGGALFGSIGLIVAAPLVSALVGISADLRKAERSAASPGLAH